MNLYTSFSDFKKQLNKVLSDHFGCDFEVWTITTEGRSVIVEGWHDGISDTVARRVNLFFGTVTVPTSQEIVEGR